MSFIIVILCIFAALGGSLVTTAWVSSHCSYRDGLQLWRVTVNTLNKQLLRADKGCSSSMGVGHGAQTLTIKNNYNMKYSLNKLPN
jgi:hypothetical protein